MKWSMAFVALVLSVASLRAQTKISDTKITAVTVFVNKAQITRTWKGKTESGKNTWVVLGLPALIDPQSVQVSGKGKYTILGVHVATNYLDEQALPSSIKKIKDSVEIYTQRVTLETKRKDLLIKEEQLLLANQKIGGANATLEAEELEAMANLFRNRLNDIATATLKQDEKLKKTQEKLTKYQAQYHEMTQQYNQNTTEISIAYAADGASLAELELTYVVPNAGWKPLYDIRATATSQPLQVNMKAEVLQNTGEEWKDVQLTLSTGNPSLGGQKPELAPWHLDFYEPRSVAYRAMKTRQAGMDVASAPMADSQSELLQEPTVAADYTERVESSFQTSYQVKIPYTVPSNAKPITVEIRQDQVKAEFNYAVTPKLDNDVFLIARVTDWADLNLIPGNANIYLEGTYTGQTFLNPQTGDTLNVSLGRDKRIIVTREANKNYSSRSFFGNTKKVSYSWDFTIRNTKNENAKVILEDQLPISNNSQIEVSPDNVSGAQWDRTTGKVTWTLTVAPNKPEKITFGYTVKYPKNKTVSGL